MSTTTSTHDHRDPSVEESAAGVVLASVRSHQAAAEAEHAAVLAGVLAWCELHVTDDPDQGATWGETPVRLGGEGCPWVAEFTITELATALGRSLPSCRALVADVLELAFRLPKLWAKVQHGEVASWRARRVAEQTQTLSIEAASFVDAQVADFAARVGVAAVERLVAEATARFMPETARAQREAAADGRCFEVLHDQVSFCGTSRVAGELDLADALDLDAAVAGIAEQLADLGSGLPVDQRRALAAGELARRQLALDLAPSTVEPDETEPVDTRRVSPSKPCRVSRSTPRRPRALTPGADVAT